MSACKWIVLQMLHRPKIHWKLNWDVHRTYVIYMSINSLIVRGKARSGHAMERHVYSVIPLNTRIDISGSLVLTLLALNQLISIPMQKQSYRPTTNACHETNICKFDWINRIDFEPDHFQRHADANLYQPNNKNDCMAREDETEFDSNRWAIYFNIWLLVTIPFAWCMYGYAA